jgi:hypothetical protein
MPRKRKPVPGEKQPQIPVGCLENTCDRLHSADSDLLWKDGEPETKFVREAFVARWLTSGPFRYVACTVPFYCIGSMRQWISKHLMPRLPKGEVVHVIKQTTFTILEPFEDRKK